MNNPYESGTLHYQNFINDYASNKHKSQDALFNNYKHHAVEGNNFLNNGWHSMLQHEHNAKVAAALLLDLYDFDVNKPRIERTASNEYFLVRGVTKISCGKNAQTAMQHLKRLKESES
jgi:hypothetical protein